ncbi:hypothetical protein [Paraherbaspirillum soli]|uniref:Uncharacterized protein n=1 Tax=Paraherbaspirillum soli TaxID=631222 RepID=A0ABW0MAP6_9BURK
MTDLNINATSRTMVFATSESNAANPTAPVNITGKAEFDAQNNVHHHPHRHHQAQGHQNVLKSPRNASPQRPQKKSGVNRTAVNSPDSHDDDDDDDLGFTANQAIRHLKEGGGEKLDAWLEGKYDALEQHTLLRRALEKSDGKDSEGLKQAISRLEEKHGDALKSALPQAEAFETAIDRMGALAKADRHRDPAALNQIRDMFGGRAGDKQVKPFAASELADTLLNKFGPQHFVAGLAQLRSVMSAPLRSSHGSNQAPRMWLSMSDAGSYNAIQSSLAIGRDLHGKLAVSGMTPHKTEAETSIELLRAPGQDVAKSKSELLKTINGNQARTPAQQAQVSRLLAHAVDTLPLRFWPQESMGQRADLLVALRGHGGQASAVASANTAEAALEKQLRASTPAAPARSAT